MRNAGLYQDVVVIVYWGLKATPAVRGWGRGRFDGVEMINSVWTGQVVPEIIWEPEGDPREYFTERFLSVSFTCRVLCPLLTTRTS